ncbi:hypothetical protein [Phytohabitans aurantiacus]|uniref:Uncharacterized protein n=1 Tax=Phytohabitans aurantiacus TaxID=3016789 RepID=A0ABQ5R9F4_9ACTN|nr:hypothetical protein [Phytohabitans aurantiacus]GLI03384.1 hypothetical protein Pa4123_86620 [Phytohabitans aurantiacus]
MGKKAFGAVVAAFFDEVAATFEPLARDLDLVGPEIDTVVLSAASYHGRGIQYEVMLNSRSMTVTTKATIGIESKDLVADLGDLVQAAGIAARNHVPHNAHTLASLRHVLEAHATYIRQIHPRLTSQTAIEFMHAANAREWNRG